MKQAETASSKEADSLQPCSKQPPALQSPYNSSYWQSLTGNAGLQSRNGVCSTNPRTTHSFTANLHWKMLMLKNRGYIWCDFKIWPYVVGYQSIRTINCVFASKCILQVMHILNIDIDVMVQVNTLYMSLWKHFFH